MTPVTKRLAIALAISVALNFLLAGFWIGRALDRRHHRRLDREASASHGRMRGDGLGRLLEGSNLDFRQRREATRAARESVRAVLAQEPFDRAKLEQALATLRSETAKSQEALHKALLDSADKGGPEQRRRIRDAFDGPRKRWH